MKLNCDISAANPNCVYSIVPLSFQILIRESARGRVPSYLLRVPPPRAGHSSVGGNLRFQASKEGSRTLRRSSATLTGGEGSGKTQKQET